MDITSCKLSYDEDKEEELFKLAKELVFKGKSIEIDDVNSSVFKAVKLILIISPLPV